MSLSQCKHIRKAELQQRKQENTKELVLKAWRLSFLLCGFKLHNQQPQFQLLVSRRLPPQDQNWKNLVIVPWFNNRDKDAGGLKAWSTVTICLFFYTNITISCSKHCMCATELSSVSWKKHSINCNKMLQLRHSAIQLPTSSLASQLSLCLTKKIQKPWKTSCS